MRLSLKKAVLLWSVLALIGPVLGAPKIYDDVERFSSPRAPSSGAVAMSPQLFPDQEEARATPAPKCLSEAEAVKPTPGQAVAQEQRNVLIRENFVAVFEEDIVTKWLSEAQWARLQDDQVAFDDTHKRNALKNLQDKMWKSVKDLSPSSKQRKLYDRVHDLREKAEAVHPDRLEEHTKGYFLSQFPGATISFKDKIEGVQLGQRAMITTQTGDRILYHVKTHSEGCLAKSSQCSAPKDINPRELMVYKLLEELGVGCECHFFGRNEKDFYIATKDAGHLESGQQGSFETFDKIIKDEEQSKDSLWSGLSELTKEFPSDFDHAVFEEKLRADGNAQHFIHQMATVDLLCRVCNLEDALTNSENFGFVSVPAEMPKLKVIDFRVDPYNSRYEKESDGVAQGFWNGFLSGNGTCKYKSSHPARRYVVHDRARETRFQMAQEIFESGALKGAENCVGKACQAVEQSLNAIASENPEELTQALREHQQFLQCNLQLFRNKLSQPLTDEDRAYRKAVP